MLEIWEVEYKDKLEKTWVVAETIEKALKALEEDSYRIESMTLLKSGNILVYNE